MSYDISFRVKVEGLPDQWVEAFECDAANITWNVREIIVQSTGLEWKNEANNGLCSEVIPKIEAGFIELKNNPDKYKHLESPNGWGTVNGTIRFFSEILVAWNNAVRTNPELASVTYFWIL